MRPQPPLLAGVSVRRPSASCLGEWQEALSLPHPRAEHPLVAQTTPGNLRISAKDLFIAAIAGWPRQLSGLSFGFGARSDCSVLSSIFISATCPTYTIARPAPSPPAKADNRPANIRVRKLWLEASELAALGPSPS